MPPGEYLLALIKSAAMCCCYNLVQFNTISTGCKICETGAFEKLLWYWKYPLIDFQYLISQDIHTCQNTEINTYKSTHIPFTHMVTMMDCYFLGSYSHKTDSLSCSVIKFMYNHTTKAGHIMRLAHHCPSYLLKSVDNHSICT